MNPDRYLYQLHRFSSKGKFLANIFSVLRALLASFLLRSKVYLMFMLLNDLDLY